MKRQRAIGGLVCALLLLAADSAMAADGEDGVVAEQNCKPRQLLRVFPPKYPAELLKNGNSGSVLVMFRATPEGDIFDVELSESAHASLERVTIAALLQSRAEPVPAADAALYCQQLGKRFNYVQTSNDSSVRFPTPFRMSTADLAALPEALRYDTPPDIKIAVPVVYPYEQLGNSIDGEASVDFLIDPTGRVQQIKVTSATHEAFGRALEASLTAWKFKPATKKSEPSWSAARYARKFSSEQRDLSFDVERPALLREFNKTKSSIPTAAELDRPPKPLYRPQPMLDPAQAYEKEAVRLEFIVDKSGFVRYPHALQARDQRLAWSAITAMSRWQFEPPMKDGKAVDVRVTMAMQF